MTNADVHMFVTVYCWIPYIERQPYSWAEGVEDVLLLVGVGDLWTPIL